MVEMWRDCRVRFLEALRDGTFPRQRTVFCASMDFARIVLGARIMVEADDAGMLWQLHPRPDMASAKSWAWIVAVRAGFGAAMLRRMGTLAYQEWHAAITDDPGLAAYAEAVMGDEIIDLVAFSLNFSRCYGAMRGHAVVIGHPQCSEYGSGPVRVFKDFVRWFEGRCAGVVMVGSEAENIDWLRGCEGIVTDDVRHGEALLKRLKRPYDGPKILVAA